MKKVAVILGSDSDWPWCSRPVPSWTPWTTPLRPTFSVHTAPPPRRRTSRPAPRANGFGVLICAAGMAAHLAGAFAANTTLPVIGIPLRGGAMDGLDALLSTVQMPSGIPVATVAINGAKNAAILAAEILAVSDDALAAKLEITRQKMAAQISQKELALQNELKK